MQLVQLVRLVLQVGQLVDRTMQGRMGMALLPGSTRVLDRRTNTMVTCTKATCPLAQGYTTEVCRRARGALSRGSLCRRLRWEAACSSVMTRQAATVATASMAPRL